MGYRLTIDYRVRGYRVRGYRLRYRLSDVVLWAMGCGLYMTLWASMGYGLQPIMMGYGLSDIKY